MVFIVECNFSIRPKNNSFPDIRLCKPFLVLMRRAHCRSLSRHFTYTLCITSALFWDITQRWMVVLYRRFRTTYRPHRQGSKSPRNSEAWNHPVYKIDVHRNHPVYKLDVHGRKRWQILQTPSDQQRHIPKGLNLQQRRSESFKFRTGTTAWMFAK
jgi:hypothetical protein